MVYLQSLPSYYGFQAQKRISDYEDPRDAPLDRREPTK